VEWRSCAKYFQCQSLPQNLHCFALFVRSGFPHQGHGVASRGKWCRVHCFATIGSQPASWTSRVIALPGCCLSSSFSSRSSGSASSKSGMTRLHFLQCFQSASGSRLACFFLMHFSLCFSEAGSRDTRTELCAFAVTDENRPLHSLTFNGRCK
jgi:hypothetical protein